MAERLWLLYASFKVHDLAEIGILSALIYGVLRFLGRTRGSGIVRGLGVIVIASVLLAQLVIAAFDLVELGKLLDFLWSEIFIGLVVVFQPELRRGLMLLGRYPTLHSFVWNAPPIADALADAAAALSRDCIGALIAIQRAIPLAAYAETGEHIDADVSTALVHAIFCPRSPLHDGAAIIANGRVVAARCQLPLGQSINPDATRLGMRHRAALCLSDETDALVLVVSEETGRISLAVAGHLEPIARENVSRRLARLISGGESQHSGTSHAA